MPDGNNNQPANQTTSFMPPTTDDVVPPMPSLSEANTPLNGVPQPNEQLDSTPATVVADTGSAAPSDDLVMPAVVGTVPPPAKKYAGGKIIATILGLFLLVGGVGAGVFLTGQNQNIRERANNDKDCTPTEDNNWGEDLPDCTKCEVLEACNATDNNCSAEYASDCQDKDIEFIARCDNVKAYSASWVLLSQSDLSNLKAGDQVNFCATGYSNMALPFTAARFTINGVLRPETRATRPGGVPNEFCDLYTIPTGVTTFTVSAEVKRLRVWR